MKSLYDMAYEATANAQRADDILKQVIENLSLIEGDESKEDVLETIENANAKLEDVRSILF